MIAAVCLAPNKEIKENNRLHSPRNNKHLPPYTRPIMVMEQETADTLAELTTTTTDTAEVAEVAEEGEAGDQEETKESEDSFVDTCNVFSVNRDVSKHSLLSANSDPYEQRKKLIQSLKPNSLVFTEEETTYKPPKRVKQVKPG